MRTLLLSLGAATALVSGCAVVAQTVQGLDLDRVRARATDQVGDAQALSTEVARRADAFRKDAEQIRISATEKMKTLDPKALPKGPAGAIDFDAIVTAAGESLQDHRGDAPQFMVFVSLSMPPRALKPIIEQVSRAGGVVVFRGFPGNSAKLFVRALSKVVDKQSQFASIGIDPRLFRAFDVTAVPTYVVVSSDFDLCDGLSCTTAPPPFDRMIGNVSPQYALETISGDTGPGALVARTALANLGAAR